MQESVSKTISKDNNVMYMYEHTVGNLCTRVLCVPINNVFY